MTRVLTIVANSFRFVLVVNGDKFDARLRIWFTIFDYQSGSCSHYYKVLLTVTLADKCTAGRITLIVTDEVT